MSIIYEGIHDGINVVVTENDYRQSMASNDSFIDHQIDEAFNDEDWHRKPNYDNNFFADLSDEELAGYGYTKDSLAAELSETF
jgi:hypothetical protein